MGHLLVLPTLEYIHLNRDAHHAWMIYNIISKRIVDAHVPGLKYRDFNERLSTFLGAGYKVMERGQLTRRKYVALQTL